MREILRVTVTGSASRGNHSVLLLTLTLGVLCNVFSYHHVVDRTCSFVTPVLFGIFLLELSSISLAL